MTAPGPVSALRPDRVHPTDLARLAGPAAGLDPSLTATGITLDSRTVRPGEVYVALPGERHHGAEFTTAAVTAGAVAVLTDAEGARIAGGSRVPVVVVASPRIVMAEWAAAIYGRPGEALTVYAVTGTNGKTTTTYLLEAALQAMGRHTGSIGTIGFRLDGVALPGARTTITTPEAPDLQALLAYLRERGADSVSMEVSSHALVLGRVDGLIFDVAAFTNLGRDHLDFHGDVESYFAAKAALFTPERARRVVINIDDPRGVELVARSRTAGMAHIATLSLTGEADYRVVSLIRHVDGPVTVSARLRDRRCDFTLALPGDFNVRNALTALAMIDLAQPLSTRDLERAAAGLAGASVPGRMERLTLGPGAPQVYVDFAHTPQAVTAALAALGPVRRIVVLGCGGDRDDHKRGPMGAAAVRGADVVVITDDNPRSEVPVAIRRAVLAGAEDARRTDGRETVIIDGGERTAAIRRALELAGPRDAVAILGKGHEDGQDVGGAVLPFSDVQVAREQWTRLHPGAEA